MKNKIKQAEIDVLNDLYNIILNNHINGYERAILLSAKNELEYEQNYTKTLMKLQTELNGFAIVYKSYLLRSATFINNCPSIF